MNALTDFLPDARMISGSKSSYSRQYPDHVVIFNANLCTRANGKIWYGDIDLTVDADKLLALRAQLGEDVFILYEMDARFENEAAPLLEKARACVTENGVEVR